MEYLLKTSAVVTIFYLSYKLFLQRDTFFESNRWFLLLGLIISFIIPFLVIPIYVEYTPIDLSNYTFDTPTISETTEKPFDVLDYLPIVYYLGVTFFSIRFIIQFVSLVFVIIKNKGEKSGSYTFIKTSNNVSPFSFFNWIVFNPDAFSETELEQIITHEKVHAKQRHSFDIVLTHISCIILWFNPFIWFYNKDLKQNLEFIADKIAQSKFNSKSYQTTLLKTSLPSHQMALSNNFYNSLIKKRIVMLHKSKSKKINQIKYALVIPVLILFLMSFNTKTVYVEKEIRKEGNPNLNTINFQEINIVFNKDLTSTDLEKIKESLKKDSIDFTYTKVKRNKKKEMVSISTKFEDKNGNATWNAYSADNKPIHPFYFFRTETSFGVGPLKNKELDTNKRKEGKNIAQELKPFSVTITKNFTDIDFKKIINEANKKGITLKFNNIKRNSNNEIIAIDAEFKHNKGEGNFNLNGKDPIKSFSYKQNDESFGFGTEWETKFIVGKPMSTSQIIGYKDVKSKEGYKIISSDSILFNKNVKSRIGVYSDSIKISPWKITIGRYASSIDFSDTLKTNNKWKVTSTKNNNLFHIKDTIYTKKNMNKSLVFSNSLNQPLYIINGIETTKDEFEKIDENEIYSISVLKDTNATRTYGERGRDGVVLITLKNENTKKHIIKLESSALYIVDGKEINEDKIKDLNPDDIESVNVLKGKLAIEKYGKKGKNDVIEIKTKKKK